MEYSDLIYIFLDGEATENERTLLFSALATDDALQSEFNDAFRMHTSVQKEIEVTTPPPALTNQLFAKAGFGEIPDEKSKKKAAWLSLLLLLLKNWGIPLVSAVGGAVLAVAVMMWNSNNQHSTGSLTSMKLDNNQPVTKTVQTEPHTQPFSQNDTLIKKKRNSSLPVSSSMEVPRVKSTGEIKPAGEMLYNKTQDSDNRIISAPYSSYSHEIPKQSVLHNTISTQIFNFPGSADELPDYSLQVNGHNGIGQHGDTPASSLNNISLSFSSYLTPNHLLGAQIGQESFPIYSTAGEFERNVSVFWVGALYRYEMDGISALGNIQPFVQAVAAGSRSGPLGKATAGIMWQPDSRVVLSLGVEGTALIYQYQSASYGTQKLGLNYGISIKF